MCDNSECVIEYIKGVRDVNSLKKYPNPLYRDMTCGLLNSRKDAYYTHSYTPPPALSELPYLTGIDLTSRTNCCMCVSVTLYFTRELDFKLYMYLANIIRTVGNVKKYLPDWLVRIYIDPSVFSGLIRYKHTVPGEDPSPYILGALEALFKAKNVEMYTYFCDSTENMQFRRTYRFLPMIDPSVAAYAIREADGIVTVLDCNNLRYMANNRIPMYMVPYRDNIPVLMGYSYQTWLTRYTMDLEYYKTHGAVVDLLAGTYSGTIKVLPDHYYSCMNEAMDWIVTKYSSRLETLDEIFLARLYRDLICIDKPPIEINSRNFPQEIKLAADERLRILSNAIVDLQNLGVPSLGYRDSISINFKMLTWDEIKNSPDLETQWKSREDELIPLDLLLCSPDQFRDLMDWFETITETACSRTLDPYTPTSIQYLRYEMIERLIRPTDHIMNMTIVDIDNRGTVMSHYYANVSHITIWCDDTILSVSMATWIPRCHHNELKLMDQIRVRTKHIINERLRS